MLPAVPCICIAAFFTEAAAPAGLDVVMESPGWPADGFADRSSDLSELTQYGEWQARRVRAALENIPFDGCFSSPISRAKQTAHIIWEGKPLEHLRYLDDLREAHLGWFQGMSNKQAAEEHSEMYRTWRDNPAEFVIEGRNPVLEVFEQAKQAWSPILSAEGHSYLVVTHKSVLRALLCTSLGLPASSFRVLDINNAGVCMLKVNCRGEPMLSALNLTSHIHTENVHY